MGAARIFGGWQSALRYTVIASLPTAPLRVAAMVENEPVKSGHREAGTLQSKCLKPLMCGISLLAPPLTHLPFEGLLNR
jgi:hypothetical protein